VPLHQLVKLPSVKGQLLTRPLVSRQIGI